jgi:CheY-like chemotaxis protein
VYRPGQPFGQRRKGLCWLKQASLREQPPAVRRFASWAQSAILLAGLLWMASAFGAAQPWPQDQTAEQRYWKKVHEREAQANSNEAQSQQEQRESIKASLDDLVREGAAIQPELIIATDGPSAPVKPSIFEGKGEYVVLSLAGLLIVFLTVCTLIRHKREAEIRALAGNYLSDGTEAARFEMPALFAAPPPPDIKPAADFYDSFADDKKEEADQAKAALRAFFALAPERLADLRKLLADFGKAFDDAERHQVLTKLYEGICALKSKAEVWDLRPIWQMSSALELLLKRLVEKGKEATPSTLGSVTSAIELLGELCVPGVRPDLIITPPISVLAVDDDPLCLRAVVFALQKAEMTPDVAEDGEKAVALATQKYYDVVFMDIQMPGIDGLTACTEIHKTAKNLDTPVIFVTVRSDFQTRAESVLKGGSDLMAKPFLMFEITVKALTYAMRKRLQLQKSLSRQTLGAGLLSESAEIAPVLTPDLTAPARPIQTPAVTTVPSVASESSADVTIDLNGDLLAKAPEYLAATRKMLEEINAASDQAKRQDDLGKLYLRIHALAEKAKLSHLEFAARTSSALEALLKRLHQNPKAVTPSTLNTVSNALSVLDRLCARGVEQKLADHPAIKIMVVEDEPMARRAVVGTLQLAFEKPDSANDGVEALNLAAQKTYDVIFSDIEMPLMGGFGFCTRIREGGPNQNTPVVFITSHIGFEVRAQAVQSGGSDFIAKPFLPIEITVKALTFALEGRLRKINAGPVLVSPLTVPAVAEPNLPRELLPAVNG